MIEDLTWREFQNLAVGFRYERRLKSSYQYPSDCKMVDPGTIATIGGALKALQGVVVLAKKIDKEGLQAEFLEQILDLQTRLMEVQSDLISMKEENELLRSQLALQSMDYRDGMYWDGDDGPFCPGCVDGNKIRARVAKNPGNGFYVCEVCKGSPQGAPRPADYR